MFRGRSQIATNIYTRLPPSYTLAYNLDPTNDCLDRKANTVPVSKATPEKMINPEYPPFCLLIIAPAIGLPVRAPNADAAYMAPLRTPSLRTSEMLATMAGRMDNVHPDVKPYRTPNTISTAFDRAGNHTARLNMAPRRVCTIITLKTPNMSPSCAGTMRPNVL